MGTMLRKGEVGGGSSELDSANTGRSGRIVGLYHRQIEHLLKDLGLHGSAINATSGGSLAQAGPARTTRLKNPGLFRCLIQGLPTGGHPWDESRAPLALQNRFARGIAWINGDKGPSDFFDQHRIQVAVRREAAVTVARAGPDDPEASGGQLTLGLQSLDGPPAHRTGIILVSTNPLHDIALIGTGVALAFVIEAAESQIMRRIEP